MDHPGVPRCRGLHSYPRTGRSQTMDEVLGTHNALSCFALLADQVSAAAQAASTVWVSSSVGWWWAWGRYFAVMMTRRSLIVMSSSEGSVLVRYQRERDRRSATSAGACPAVAYQTVTRLRHSNPNGTVRSTAWRVQLRAWPTPRTWRA